MIRKILILFLIFMLFNFSILMADPDDVVGPNDGSSKGDVKNVYENSWSFELKELSGNQDTQIVFGLLPNRQQEMFDQKFYLS